MRSSILVGLFGIMLVTLSAQDQKDTLKVGYTSAPPFIIVDGEQPEGLNIWLWERVAEELDLVYELIPMGFSEMLVGLADSSIDVSINPLTITSERIRRINFTHSFFASNSTIVVREKTSFQKLGQSIQSFFDLNFLRGFFILLSLIFFFGLIAWYFERKVNPTEFRPGWKGIYDGLWWSVVTMTTVGYGDKSPKSVGGKMIALVWMFSGLLFISGLTASVASSLTINQLISSPDDFNEFKERKVGSVANSSTSEFLKLHFFKELQEFEDLTAGLAALQEDQIEAFLYDEPILKYRLARSSELEGLELLPIDFDLQFYAFGLAKGNNLLRDQISQQILEFTESLEWRIILTEYDLSEI